jgi:hypothetical protein
VTFTTTVASSGATPPDASGQLPASTSTTGADIVVQVVRAWAPIGADHFYALVQDGFYTEAAFFRVVPDFARVLVRVVLFGFFLLNAAACIVCVDTERWCWSCLAGECAFFSYCCLLIFRGIAHRLL